MVTKTNAVGIVLQLDSVCRALSKSLKLAWDADTSAELGELYKRAACLREALEAKEADACPLCGQHITDGKPCGCGARQV